MFYMNRSDLMLEMVFVVSQDCKVSTDVNTPDQIFPSKTARKMHSLSGTRVDLLETSSCMRA